MVTFVRLDGLAFFDLGLDGGLSAKITGDVVLQELLEKGVFGDDAALGWSDVPVVRAHTIPMSNSQGRCRVVVVREAWGSESLSVIDAGQDVEADRAGLVFHPDGIITDGAVVG